MHPAVTLTWCAATLATAAATVGIASDVYSDAEPFILAGWLGNDVAVLVFLVPALVIGALASKRGWGRLLWLGALAAAVYNYAFYVFGAAPNPLLLLHITIMAATLLALLMGLVTLDAHRYPPPAGALRGFLLLYMSLWGVLLAAIWTIQAATAALAGQAPELNGSAHAFQVTASLDLVLVVPYVALAVALVARRRPWATPTAAVLNVKGVIYPAVLVASSVTAHQAGVPGALDLVPLWTGFLAASGTASFLLLRRCT